MTTILLVAAVWLTVSVLGVVAVARLPRVTVDPPSVGLEVVEVEVDRAA